MFKYLIVPSDQNQSPVILAFTIQSNVITGYYNSIPIQYDFLDKIPFINHIALQFNPHYQLVKCAKDYQKTHPRTLIDLHDNHPYHYLLHDTENEKSLNHFHYSFKDRISEEILRDFLTQLQNCDKLNSFDTGYKFISEDVINDILSKFKENKEQYTSNSREYSQHEPLGKFVKIEDHVAAIDSGAPFFNQQAQLSATTGATSQLSNMQLVAGTVGLIATVGFGIFAATRCSQPKSTAPQDQAKVETARFRRKNK